MRVYAEKESGPFFSDWALLQAVKEVKARSMPVVIESLKQQRYSGIGAGSGLYNTEPPSLWPKVLQTVRTVRLFKRMHCTDSFWIEQLSCQKTTNVADFCSAIEKAVPYNMSEIPGQCAKPYWGARAQNIKDLYGRFVPPEFVEDKYVLHKGGASGLITQAAMEYIDPISLARIDANPTAQAGEAIQMGNAVGVLTTLSSLGDGMGELVVTSVVPHVVPVEGEYRHSFHGPLIIEACGGKGSQIITSKKGMAHLSLKLGLDNKQLRYAMKKLIASTDLTAT